MAMTPETRGAERGSLLLEALAAMALLAVAFLATAPLLVVAARENAAARDLTVSTTVAHGKAEELKREHFAVIESGLDVVEVGGVQYTRNWLVFDDDPHPGMRTVTVTVTPNRGGTYGGNRVATVRFYRAAP